MSEPSHVHPPDDDTPPRDIAGPLGPVDPGDVVSMVWTEGYHRLEGGERWTARETLLHHHDRVTLWYRLLTLYLRAFDGLAGASEADSAEADPTARALRLRLLALSGGSAKLALDATLAGAYSQAFALIRHMLECSFQVAYARYFPRETRRWYRPHCAALGAFLRGGAQGSARACRGERAS